MKGFSGIPRCRWQYATVLAPAIAILITLFAQAGSAGTTGTVTGTVTDAETRAPLQSVKVSAASPSGGESTYTNRAGFYSLQALTPDTYTITFSLAGYDVATTIGVTVNQDQTSIIDRVLVKTVKSLGRVPVRAASNLVQPHTGTDVYNVNGAQLAAASGGDSLHKTLYEYTATVPGLTPIGGGFPAEPSIHGGQDTDNGYEFDGIPIAERITGFFTTNLSNIGIGNLEVYTGGLNAGAAANGTGIINSVAKVGRYPAFGTVALGITNPVFNHKMTLEYGGATPDNRWSYYMGFGGVISDNDYNNGVFGVYPKLVYGGSGVSSTNAGPVNTRDIVANFHYKPGGGNDFQFLLENSLYDQSNNYLLFSGNAATPLLMMQPCPGAKPDPTDATGSYATGGIAPNGQPCPAGLFYAPLPNGAGVVTAHYGGLGKIQWNHIIGDHASIAVHLAENFNQYIFNQNITDPNNPNPAVETPLQAGCPPLPYKPGTPVQVGSGYICTHDSGDYYQDRNSRMYLAGLDYTDTPNEHLSWKAGIGQEYDQNYRGVFNLASFNPNTGAWAGMAYYGSLTDIPTHIPYIYAQASINSGRFTLEPGARYQREWYGMPIITGVSKGAMSVGAWVPTFAGTYRVNDDNVVRFSWGDTQSFIGTEFVWRISGVAQGPGFYNPWNAGTSINPQINHTADLMWEHQFAPNTSLRIGPWLRHSDNYFQEYNPIIGFDASGNPIYSKLDVPANGLKIRAFGAELGFNHTDNRPEGASVWLSGSYDNFWTTATSGNISYYNFPLPSNLVARGVYIRNPFVPIFSGTFLADLHTQGWHVLPLLYYSFDSFYNAGLLEQCPSGVGPAQGCSHPGSEIAQPEGKGPGYFILNTTVSKDFGHGLFTVGIRGTNLTNNLQVTTPCQVDGTGTGCYPYVGPQSGVSTTPSPAGCYGFGDAFHPACSWINQKVSQDARLYEFFLVRHF